MKLELKELCKDYGIGFEALVSVLGYVYSGKIKVLPKGVCVCVDEECLHLACRPAIDFVLEVLYASQVFQIPELVELWQVLLYLCLSLSLWLISYKFLVLSFVLVSVIKLMKIFLVGFLIDCHCLTTYLC